MVGVAKINPVQFHKTKTINRYFESSKIVLSINKFSMKKLKVTEKTRLSVCSELKVIFVRVC